MELAKFLLHVSTQKQAARRSTAESLGSSGQFSQYLMQNASTVPRRFQTAADFCSPICPQIWFATGSGGTNSKSSLDGERNGFRSILNLPGREKGRPEEMSAYRLPRVVQQRITMHVAAEHGNSRSVLLSFHGCLNSADLRREVAMHFSGIGRFPLQGCGQPWAVH